MKLPFLFAVNGSKAQCHKKGNFLWFYAIEGWAHISLHESIVDGMCIHTTVFFQGGDFNCMGCHNLATHAKDAGQLVTGLEVYEEIYNSKLASGVTFSSGEPFLRR